jgi:coniferyl-aldehyde dehydrogenase
MSNPSSVARESASAIGDSGSAHGRSDRMREIFETQRDACLENGLVTAETRIDRLDRVRKMIARNQDAIIEACHRDFGNRSHHQSRMSEVLAVMTGMQHARENVKRWMGASRRKVMFPLNLLGARARVEFQPKGVIGTLGTWNFPVYTAILPLAGIFAAGNRAMVKFSEITPEASSLMQRLIGEYFEESECAAITGGPEVGAEFASLPFDHIIFTGGTGIGRHIMRAAAENLTPVTLELGGKSPVIVGRSYDLDKAAGRIMVGKALNQGQACLAPDYCLVPREKLEEFVAAAAKHFSSMFPTIIDNPDCTSVINARHRQRIAEMIQDARDKGGDVREINPGSEDFGKQAQGLSKMPMTFVVEPTDEMRVMQEELFGPVLCIKGYDAIDDGIRYVNSRPRPLGLYYFGDDAEEERSVLDRTISGGVTINDVLTHSSCEDLPFGGIGSSGMGSYHGRDGFLTFSHQRAVFRQTRLDLMKLSGMMPPYGEKCEKQLDRLCKVD